MKKILLATVLVFAAFVLQAQGQVRTYQGAGFVLNRNYNTEWADYEFLAGDSIALEPGFQRKSIFDGLGSTERHYMNLDLDPYAVYPPQDGETGGDNNTAVATLGGTVDVGAMGDLVYTIPIEVPQGINGMQPSLAVTYDNQAGNGLMGWGWNLSGLSAITRTGKTLYHDGAISGADLDDDRFLLDGQRLVLVNGTYGESGSEYKTENDGFSRINLTNIFVVDENFSIHCYDGFQVHSKDGTIINYGISNDSRLKASDGSVIMWQVSSVSDRKGNTIKYEYSTDNATGESYIKKITYTLNGTLGIKTPQFTVCFDYAGRDDYEFFFIADNRVIMKNRLTSIVIKKGSESGKKLYEYRFSYINGDYSGSHPYYQLSTVKRIIFNEKETASNQCVTKINWSNKNPESFVRKETKLGENLSKEFPFVGDFNGDGYSDIVLVPYKENGSYSNNPSISVFLNNREDDNYFQDASYTFPNVDKTLDWVYVFDVNNDGLDDLMPFFYDKENNKTTVRLFRNEYNDASLSFTPIWEHSMDGEATVLIGDFDANGTSDVIMIKKRKEIITHYSNSDTLYSFENEAVSFRNTNGEQYVSGEVLGIPLRQFKHVTDAIAADFTGDGKSEILLVFESGDAKKPTVLDVSTYQDYLNILPSNIKFGRNDYPHCSLSNQEWSNVFVGDFNGDGKADLLDYYSTQWSTKLNVYYATGDTDDVESNFTFGSITNPSLQLPGVYYQLYTPSLSMIVPNRQIRICVEDFDGDGRSDIAWSGGGQTDYIQFYSFLSNSRFKKSWSITTNHFYFHSQYIHTGRFYPKASTSILSMLKPEGNHGRQTAYIFAPMPIPEYCSVTSIVDNLGNATSFGYGYLMPKPSSSFYTFDFRKYDGNDIKTGAMPVLALSSCKSHNVGGGESVTSYSYSNALFHKTGRGFIGFESVTSANSVGGILKSRTIRQYETETMGCHAMTLPKMEKTTVPMANGEGERTAKVQSYEFDKVVCSRNQKGLVVCPAMTKKTVRKFDIDNGQSLNKLLSETTTEYQYDYSYNQGQYTYQDCYACPTTTEEVKGFDENNACHQELLTTKKSHFTSNTGNWILNRKDDETIDLSRPGKPNVCSYTEYDYVSDNSYLPKLIKFVPNGDGDMNDRLALETELSYDRFGNLTKKITRAPNGTQGEGTHINSYEYGANYNHRLLTKERVGTVADGYVTTYEYDNFDRLCSATDCNGKTVYYTASLLGTSHATTAIDGTELKQVSRWVDHTKHAPEDASYYTWSKQSGGSPALTFYHKTGVELRTVTFNLHSEPIYVDKHYDRQGLLQEVSLPYGKDEEPQWTAYEYDIYDRPTTVTLPDHSETHTDYDGFLTTSAYYPDALGHPDVKQETIQKVNALGWATESTDDEGTTVHYDYFPDGKLEWTQIGNDQSTRISLQYDNARNRTELIDPNYGKTISLYNAFGEEKTRTNPKQQTTTFLYDDFGRMTDRTDGGENINTHWAYFEDQQHKGLLESVSYGDQTITYTYDDFQRVQSTTDRGYTTSYTYDPVSRVASVTYPSGYTLNTLYRTTGHLLGYADNDGNMLWQTDEVSPRGELLQSTMGGNIVTTRTFHPEKHLLTSVNTVVGENNLQNLTYSYDNFNNLEARIDNTRNLNETFLYDNLNRLTDISLNGEPTGQMAYDDYGRMKSKTMDGQLVFQGATFDPTAKPHAIRSAQTGEGVFPDVLQEIEYTSFDKVKTIAEGDKRLAYTYGYNRQRIGMDETANGRQRSKVYVGNCEYITETAEGVTTEKVLTYLSGPTGVFAVVEKQNGEGTTHFILKDHLGSWTTITDAEGNIEQELSFDAWGNLRNPETWTGSSTEAPMFDRGYTGHEHITAFGLINMNGRCYDPVMSSFLSVDEYVQDPSSAQNFNRYSYCLNNPLKYVDPSGWMYSGGSHSEECEFNRYRRYTNAHLTEEQWANCGINRAVLTYVKMGVGYIMTPFMQGEKQKGGGGGIVIKGNDGVHTTYTPGMTYKGNDQLTKDAVNSLNEIYTNGGDLGKQLITTLVNSRYTLYIEDLGEGGSYFKEENTTNAYYDQTLEGLCQSQIPDMLKREIGSGGTIYWNRGQQYRNGEEMILNSTMALCHELVHGWDACWGVLQDGQDNPSDLNYREWSACYWSNRIAQDMGIPIMTHYADDSKKHGGEYNPMTKEFSGKWYKVVDSYNNPIYKSRY